MRLGRDFLRILPVLWWWRQRSVKEPFLFMKNVRKPYVFVDKLISMGAGIILCDPHRAVISGPSRLSGAQLASPDVRAGMAMIIAALAASGTSTISNVYQIERGYENIVERLQQLGAKSKW